MFNGERTKQEDKTYLKNGLKFDSHDKIEYLIFFLLHFGCEDPTEKENLSPRNPDIKGFAQQTHDLISQKGAHCASFLKMYIQRT